MKRTILLMLVIGLSACEKSQAPIPDQTTKSSTPELTEEERRQAIMKEADEEALGIALGLMGI